MQIIEWKSSSKHGRFTLPRGLRPRAGILIGFAAIEATGRAFLLFFQHPPGQEAEEATLEEIPAKTLGVIRFSGLENETGEKRKADELRTWLIKAGHEISAGPSIAGYDLPWPVPFLRRNEIMYEIGRD